MQQSAEVLEGGLGNGKIQGAVLVVVAVAVTGALLAAAITVSADPGTILRFDTMAPVTGPYVGATNSIRGIPGGGLPWVIQSGEGTLTRDGHLTVRVRDLVLAGTAPVPPALQLTNPVPDFKAVVSCQSISPQGAPIIVNVSTQTFPANKDGNSNITGSVQLPHPCIAPIVFVTSPGSPTSPTGAWFASTGS